MFAVFQATKETGILFFQSCSLAKLQYFKIMVILAGGEDNLVF